MTPSQICMFCCLIVFHITCLYILTWHVFNFECTYNSISVSFGERMNSAIDLFLSLRVVKFLLTPNWQLAGG